MIPLKSAMIVILLLVTFTCLAGEKGFDWETAERGMVCGAGEGRCGFTYRRDRGWQEVARCFDGYHWGYLLRGGKEATQELFCGGFSTSHGPVEFPCLPFVGSAQRFRATAERVLPRSKPPERGERPCYGEMVTLVPTSFIEGVGALLTPRSFECSLTRCRGTGCGCDLVQAGWIERARCQGHQWRYVLQKGEELRICKGIAARGGHEEEPCQVYSEDLSRWSCESGGEGTEKPRLGKQKE